MHVHVCICNEILPNKLWPLLACNPLQDIFGHVTGLTFQLMHGKFLNFISELVVHWNRSQ